MRRLVRAVAAAGVLALALALPAGAGARTNWVCDVPGEGTVTFVSAGDAAFDGLTQANRKAGEVFRLKFGEDCEVVPG